MTIKKTRTPNYYIVLDGVSPVAGFNVIENKYNGTVEISWDFGEDEVPLEIVSEANQMEYVEE